MSLFGEYISEYLDEGKYTVIASFDMPFEDDNVDEATVVSNTNLGGNANNCDIRVYPNEGPVQHFHIKGQKIDCYIKIFKPEYFNHGQHNDKLNAKQIKELVDVLNEGNAKYRNMSNWEAIAYLWYVNNPTKYPDTEKDRTTEMPDYLNGLK